MTNRSVGTESEMAISRPARLNAGFIGYGQVASFHAQILRDDRHRLLRVVGPSLRKAALFAREHGFHSYGDDLTDLLDDPSIDAVWICSPSTMHAAHAHACLSAGKHVLVEVPLAMDYGDGIELVDLARSMNLVAAVGHNHRYLGGIARARQLVAANELTVLSIHGRYILMRRQNIGTSGHLRSWTDNLLWHHGMHAIDLILWVLGISHVDDLHVAAASAGRGPEWPAPMEAVLALTTSTGQFASLQLSYNSFINLNDLLVTGVENSYLISDGKLSDRSGPLLDFSSDMLRGSDNARRQLNREFVGAIVDGAVLHSSALSVLPSVAVIHKAQSELFEISHSMEGNNGHGPPVS